MVAFELGEARVEVTWQEKVGERHKRACKCGESDVLFFVFFFL